VIGDRSGIFRPVAVMQRELQKEIAHIVEARVFSEVKQLYCTSAKIFVPGFARTVHS
jgi:hypothetical protein